MVQVKRTKYGNVVKAVERAVSKSALELGIQMASQAKALAPVDHGQLRNSISVASTSKDYLLNNRKGDTAEAMDRAGLKEGGYYVGSNSDHTIYQEYGTINQPAQPFLRPSAELVMSGGNPAEIMQKFSREEMEKELAKRKEERYGS